MPSWPLRRATEIGRAASKLIELLEGLEWQTG